jgi:hypothetical protein
MKARQSPQCQVIGQLVNDQLERSSHGLISGTVLWHMAGGRLQKTCHDSQPHNLVFNLGPP